MRDSDDPRRPKRPQNRLSDRARQPRHAPGGGSRCDADRPDAAASDAARPGNTPRNNASRDTGRAPPDHATLPAVLPLMETGCASHSLDWRRAMVGAGHRLYRAIPREPAPPAGWPVLYLLDGNAAFDFLTAAHLARAPGLVVIGVGYDITQQFARDRRALDLTPPDPEAAGGGTHPDPVHPGRMAGGAAAFLDHLTGPLRQTAEDGLPIDPTRRSLWGHSFGGLFTLYALLSRAETFARYAAISPSVWWNAQRMQALAAAAPTFASGTAPPLLIALSDNERRTGTAEAPVAGPAPETLDLVRRMSRHPGLAADLRVLPGLRHIETLAASLDLALPFATKT